MELPEYGNRDAITAALKAQDALIARNIAELKMLHGYRSAIQQMCDHVYTPHPPLEDWEKCKHCGDARKL